MMFLSLLSAGLPLPLDDQTPPPQVPLPIDDLTFKPLSTTGFVPYFNYDGALAEVSGTVGLITSDDAGRVASQTFTFMLSGADSRCKDGAGDAHNSCGLHIHQGGSCKEDALGHFFNASRSDGSFDPWASGPAPIVYKTTDDFTFGEFTVLTGLPAHQIDGRTFVVHDFEGRRIACSRIAGPADEQGGQRRLQLAEPPEEKKKGHFLGVLAGAAAGALAGHLASQQDNSPHYGSYPQQYYPQQPYGNPQQQYGYPQQHYGGYGYPQQQWHSWIQGRLGQSCTSVCRERRLTCDIRALDEFARTGSYTSFNVNSLSALTRQCRAVNYYPAWLHSPAICNSPACGSTWRYNSFGGCSIGRGGSRSCNAFHTAFSRFCPCA